MIIFDTETSGFTKPEIIKLEQQPEIIEFAAVRLDDETLAVVDEVAFLCRPRILPLSQETVKATEITTEMVEVQKPFSQHVSRLTAFFLGEQTMVAHNCGFDRDVLSYELQRLDRHFRFPWPWNHVDTVELTMDIEAPRQKSARLKLSELHRVLTGFEPKVKHRAMDDVQTLLTCVRALRAKDGRI